MDVLAERAGAPAAAARVPGPDAAGAVLTWIGTSA
jgi:hypothetical protein